MAELILFGGLVSLAGGAIATGIYGSRYIDQKLHYEETIVRTDKPVILPPDRPAITWEAVRNS